MFAAQVRRAIARSLPAKTPKRSFGGHHDEHHVDYMSTHSELPKGDWRNKPMTWDFNRKPTSDYEAFVSSHLSGPNDPALGLTKGQFIVYMRRLHREEFGYKMYTQRFHAAWMFFTFVTAANYAWGYKVHNPVEENFTQRQFSSIFDQAPIQGPNFTMSQDFRFRLDEFFADHDESTIAKLPKDLRDLYNEKKDSYNEEYSSTPQSVQLSENLSPAGVKATKQALMAKYGLTEAEMIKIYQNCDAYALYQQMHQFDDEQMAATFPALSAGQTSIVGMSFDQMNEDGAIEKEIEAELKADFRKAPLATSLLRKAAV